MANTKHTHIQNLFKFHPNELLHGLKTNLNVTFDDGQEIYLTSKEIIITRYLTDITTLVPGMKIKSNYAIINYYNNGLYVAKSMNKCFEAILEDIINTEIRPTNNTALLPVVYAKMYEIFNTIYNDVIYTNMKYATSLNILDFLEIQMDPKLINSLQTAYKTKAREDIDNTYNVLHEVITTNPKYSNNVIGMGYISGTINSGQVKQMLASRGFVTEIDSTIFKYPIASSFTLGLTDIYDLAIESRSGAKALFLSNKAIQESEYFARELQMIVMYITDLIHTDCGSTDYVEWNVRDASFTGKSDIENLVGKRYLNSNGVEEIITKQHKHLEGTTIKLRTAMKCKLLNKHHICSACFGELSYACHKHTCIGHIAPTSVTQKLSQSILSTKHLTSSSTSNDIVLDETSKRFFSVKNKDGYGFRASVLNKARSKLVMIVSQTSAFGLKDLSSSSNVYKLNPTRVSRIESFILNIEHTDGRIESFPIIIKNGNRYGSFQYEFLEYIIKEGYRLDDNDRYIIDLKNWTKTEAILRLPQVEFNFLALTKAIKAEFKYMKIIKGKYSNETQESLLQKIFDLVNTKLDINIALLEVIIYGFTIMTIKGENYDIGRNTNDPQLSRIKDILANRSLGAVYGWERVLEIMLDPKSFDGKNNTNHLLDVLIKPTETLLDYKEL